MQKRLDSDAKHLKFKVFSLSNYKVKNFEAADSQHSNNSEVFSMDTYQNVTAPKISQQQIDLFSGLNQTVKVTIIIFFK